MIYYLTHPLVVLILSFVSLSVAAWLGARYRARIEFNEERRRDFGVILASTLTLLGLLIGFSFSMAASRYDQRKNLEEGEANAIGTEYLRADLMPPADRAKVRELLKRYVDLRIRFYVVNQGEAARVNAETGRLQAELWATIVAASTQQPAPIMALVISGMNDVINAQGYTQAAWWNRIPLSAAILMAVIAFFCNVMLGYGSSSARPGSPIFLILPLFVAVAFMLISDIDSPRRGLIEVVPQNLLSLYGTMQ